MPTMLTIVCRKFLSLFFLLQAVLYITTAVFAQSVSDSTSNLNRPFVDDTIVQNNNSVDSISGAADDGVVRQFADDDVPSEQNYQNISISYGDSMFGTPFVFSTDAPPNAQFWDVSIAEAGGDIVFQDNGSQWDSTGYTWNPSKNIHSGIYYIFNLSFSNENGIIQTEALKFFTRIQIFDNRSPFIFFLGNTDAYNDEVYSSESGIASILDLVVSASQGSLANTRILVRGHATFVTNTVESRKEEYFELLELSRRRAIKVVEELITRGVDSNRVSYEALGGSEEISFTASGKWKNRRVEIVFLFPNEYALPTAPSQTNPISSDTNLIIQFDDSVQDNADDDSALSAEGEEQAALEQVQTDDNNSVILNQFSQQDRVYNLNEEDSRVDPWPDVPLLGDGQLTVNEMVAFLLYNSPGLNKEYARRIVSFYVIEANRERVNYDVAFAQMLLETDYLQFRGMIRKIQYNFAGIGTVDRNNEGNWFSTEQIGVRSHIQHLKGYATTQSLIGDIVDPTYASLERYGLLGSAPMVDSLSGRWASDPEYGVKIRKIMRRMYNFANAWNNADLQ